MQTTKHGERRRARKERDDAKMDMTPMIDVTFLLLIFFLCLEFKSLEGKLASNLPKDRGPNHQSFEPREILDLRIVNTNFGTKREDPRNPARFELEGHRNRYWIGRKRVASLDALDAELRKAARYEVRNPRTGRPQRVPLTIRSGPGVCYQDVTEVVDLARNASFEEITYAADRR